MLIKHKKSKRCVRATEEKNKLTLDKETYEKLMKLLKDTEKKEKEIETE